MPRDELVVAYSQSGRHALTPSSVRKKLNPSPILLREGFLVLLQCGRLDENIFRPLDGRKLKKSAFDELHEYYRGLMS